MVINMEQTQQMQQQGPTVDSNLVINQYQQRLFSTTDDLMKANAYIGTLEMTIVKQNQLVIKQDEKIAELEAKLKELQPESADNQESNTEVNTPSNKEFISSSQQA